MLQNNFKTEPLIIPLGEKRIFGELFSPTDGEKHPAVIFVHGYNSCYADFRGECEAFASNGFIAYALDFCGGSDRSKSSGLSTDMSVLTEKEELLAVIDYFAAMENVLPGKLFLLGGSQGGLVSGLAAEERRDVLGGMILYFPAYMIPDNWRPRFPTVEDIPEVLRRLALFTEPGGLLIFDVNTPERFRSLDGQVFVDEKEDALCLWRAEFDEKENLIRYGMDIFERQGKLWRREQEEHIEYAHSEEFLRSALEEAGFYDVEIIRDGPQNAFGRIFFVSVNSGKGMKNNG